MLVLDATPLIYLAKTGTLPELEHLDERVTIPESVYQEVVVAGREAGEPDAGAVDQLVDAGVFQVQAVETGSTYQHISDDPYLSEADVAVLALADQEEATAVVDEEHARSVADMEGIENRGTVYLLFRLLKSGVMDADEVRQTIDEMIEAGWYCSTDLYSMIMDRLDEYGD